MARLPSPFAASSVLITFSTFCFSGGAAPSACSICSSICWAFSTGICWIIARICCTCAFSWSLSPSSRVSDGCPASAAFFV